jgi:hypothetical protein
MIIDSFLKLSPGLFKNRVNKRGLFANNVEQQYPPSPPTPGPWVGGGSNYFEKRPGASFSKMPILRFVKQKDFQGDASP